MDIEAAIERGRRKRSLPSPEERRRIREVAGLTQADLAAVIGVDRAEISRWESGERSPRVGKNLERYLNALSRLSREVYGGDAAADLSRGPSSVGG